jgi:hypothetical protein
MLENAQTEFNVDLTYRDFLEIRPSSLSAVTNMRTDIKLIDRFNFLFDIHVTIKRKKITYCAIYITD